MGIESQLERKLEVMVKKSAQQATATGKKFAVALSGGSDSGLIAALTKTKYAITVKLPYGKRYDEFRDACRTVKHLGIKTHIVVHLKDEEFDKVMRKAVPIIGRVTGHFSLFPLYKMYERLAEEDFDCLIFGDGPDESMCGYIRCILMDYIYNAPQNLPAFKYYQPLFDKVLPSPWEVYARAIDKDPQKVRRLMEGEPLLKGMCKVEMTLTRADFGGINNALAAHFGITFKSPYTEPKLDRFMFNLPPEMKIKDYWGKYLLRKVAVKYLPQEIVWRRQKIGGPVYPVNLKKRWLEKGEFNKEKYCEYQRKILEKISKPALLNPSNLN